MGCCSSDNKYKKVEVKQDVERNVVKEVVIEDIVEKHINMMEKLVSNKPEGSVIDVHINMTSEDSKILFHECLNGDWLLMRKNSRLYIIKKGDSVDTVAYNISRVKNEIIGNLIILKRNDVNNGELCEVLKNKYKIKVISIKEEDDTINYTVKDDISMYLEEDFKLIDKELKGVISDSVIKVILSKEYNGKYYNQILDRCLAKGWILSGFSPKVKIYVLKEGNDVNTIAYNIFKSRRIKGINLKKYDINYDELRIILKEKYKIDVISIREHEDETVSYMIERL